MVDATKIIQIVKENIKGLDAFTIIPAINLDKAAKETISRIEKGLIPEIYKWTKTKTEFAYQYKSYKKWVKSIFIAAKYYYTNDENSDRFTEDKTLCYGKIAKYTWRNNYQYIIKKLNDVALLLENKLGIKIKHKALSNYTSIPEKILFNWSELGKFGKNSVLINPKFGSYFVIGELLLNLEIKFDNTDEIKPPDFSICGNCTKCIDACPTNAIVENGILNVNRCLQFISENLILVEEEIRKKWKNRLYGCTDCLDVCPYNRNLKPTAEKHSIGLVGSKFNLIEILKMNEQEWDETFSNNQIGKKDRLAIIKNAILAIGNLKCTSAKEILYKMLNHKNDIIRAYTFWALGIIDKENITSYIKAHLKQENSEIVKKEMKKLLQ